MAAEDSAVRRAGAQLYNPSIFNIDRALGFASDEAFAMASEVRRAVKRMAEIRRRRTRLERERHTVRKLLPGAYGKMAAIHRHQMRLERERHAIVRGLLFGPHGQIFWKSERELSLIRPGIRREKVSWLMHELEEASRKV
jgi:hypothetical protein